MASLLRTHRNRAVLRACCVYMRKICAAAGAESKNDKMTKEMKRRLRAEGIRAHALYKIKVDEIAANLRAKRMEEEKRQMAAKIGPERPEQLEKEEIERIIQSVELENEKMEELRNERKTSEIKMWQEEVAKRIERRNLKREALRMSRREHVLRAIEESKTWVNRENLEEKIAHCLENETNYNFALSPSGEKYYSDTPPGYVSTEGGPGRAAYIKNKYRDDIKQVSKTLL